MPGASANSIAIFNALVMTVRDCIFIFFRYRATSAVVVPESKMIVSPGCTSCGRPPNSDFFIPVQSFFGTKRIVLGGLKPSYCPAVRADDCADRSQSIQVATDSHR